MSGSGDMFPQGYIDYALERHDQVDKLAALIREVDDDYDPARAEKEIR